MSDEIVIELTLKQTQFDRALNIFENVFFGGSKGGGKSHGLREIMLKRRIEQPYSRGVIFRKTYPELYNNHIAPLLSKFPRLKDYYNNTNKELILPNKSVLMFRHCQFEKNLFDHDGVEYHDLGIEEVGDWPESWFWRLKGCNRSSIPGIKPHSALTGNPGGLGHKWLRRIFVDRNFRSIENPNDFVFIPARLSDNPALLINNPNYENTLRSNKNPMLVKAFVDGSWDIAAGQFFDVVSRETHMIAPFAIPDHWPRFGCFDTGYNHPAFFGWGTGDEDGNIFLYREYVQGGKRTEEIVKDIFEFEDTKKIQSIPAGHDCWTKHSGDPSVEEKFTEASRVLGHSLVLHRAAIDRVAGAQQLRDYLALRPVKTKVGDQEVIKMKPRLYIFDTCPITFDCITRMVHDPNRPEDVLKVDAEDGNVWTGDDPYDGIRYFLMDRPRIAIKPEEPKRRRYWKDDSKRVPSWTEI